MAATEFTRGRQEFTTVRDLRDLAGYKRVAGDYSMVCQRALGDALKAARRQLSPRDWAPVATELDLTVLECASSAFVSTWSDPQERTNAQVVRVQRIVDGLFFTNPLIRSWELQQLWLLYVAAEGFLEDTLVDLVVELRGSRRAADLADAVGLRSVTSLDCMIEEQRRSRGEIGDPRRTPTQYRAYPAREHASNHAQ
ncbi:hypothetical protein ACHIPZ_25585 [Antrihabitans sp. NCIMB 15449]|uniref:Uncharacterized protein n=1 Tax=Antrihabitans spumae TaxID=3373370 RepID=A0ABW7JUM7_9NOCA